MKYSEYGHYSEDGKEFIVTERKTPRHFYNYFFNDDINTFASQVGYGEGFAQDEMANRDHMITDRAIYLVNTETRKWHLGTGLPMTESFDFFECHHGRGYSTIICEKNGVRSEYTIFVPKKGLYELWIVRVTNTTNSKLPIHLIGYSATRVDEEHTPQGYNKGVSDLDKDADAIWLRHEAKVFRKPKLIAYDYMMVSEKPIAYDTRHNAFIGTYGSKEFPEALTFGKGCTNSETTVEKCCFALECDCPLEAGESKTFAFQIGHADTIEEIREIRKGLTIENTVYKLKEIVSLRQEQIDSVKIFTPDEKLNKAFPFYQYANNMGSRWARVRSNGYRDIVQDSECLASLNPMLAWERFKHILAYQYSTGCCPRNYLNGTINQKSSIDNGVWLSGTAYAIVNETGNKDLLLEEVDFNDGTSGTVFEHMRRSYKFLYEFQGLYGLIKIWGGDWHDGMDSAGLEGKGVSILLSIQFTYFNKLFIELAKLLGEDEIASEHEKMNEDMLKKIYEHGYCKPYFCTAINDLDQRIGAPESNGAKMYINPQTWSVIANLGTKEEQIKCMEAVDEYLETPYGTRFNYPMYKEYDPYIGHMTNQPEGTLINGAVYLQPLVWRIIADCILKRADKVQMTIEKLLPWNHKHSVSYGEPYILYNFYHAAESGYRAGTAGQSWRTATHSIFVRAMVNFVFGLKPTLNGLMVDPCLPPDWKECSIDKKFRNCSYHISYHQNSEKDAIVADGKEIEGAILPYKDGEIFVDVYIK